MDVVAHFEPAVVERPDEPFPFSHGPSDAASYARQREVVQAIAAGAEPEPLQVEETMLRVLAQVLARAYAAHGFRPPRRPRSPGHAVEIAARVQSFVAGRLGERLTLARLGRAVASSPFELCRLFRSATGWTLHAYVLELRLRAALERVAESRSDLSAVAQDFGFASHAHFTSAFRTRFGLTPSTFRSTASGSRLRAAAK
jgi:transcriptional regulator GlxA family with amidase domain